MSFIVLGVFLTSHLVLKSWIVLSVTYFSIWVRKTRCSMVRPSMMLPSAWEIAVHHWLCACPVYCCDLCALQTSDEFAVISGGASGMCVGFCFVQPLHTHATHSIAYSLALSRTYHKWMGTACTCNMCRMYVRLYPQRWGSFSLLIMHFSSHIF